MFTNRTIGPVQAEFDSTVLGLLRNENRLIMEENTVQTTADITGTTPRDEIITGRPTRVMLTMTEASLEQLSKSIAGSRLSGDKAELIIPVGVGTSLRSIAKPLVLKPIVGDTVSTVEAEWIRLLLSAPRPNFNVPFNLNDQMVWAVEFTGYPLTAADLASGGQYAGTSYQAGDILKLGHTDA